MPVVDRARLTDPHCTYRHRLEGRAMFLCECIGLGTGHSQIRPGAFVIKIAV